MRRDELAELHYITHINNVASILLHGLLSHARADKLPHESVAMEEVQARRRNVVLPTGRKLHEHVNLYLNARNAMMYKRKGLHLDLCVLRISTSVLDLNGVLVTDRNAASGIALFDEPVAGLGRVDKSRVFARSWIHEGDPMATYDHRSAMFAKVLVPDRVDPEFIQGAYVSCSEAKERLLKVAGDGRIIINGYLFFRAGGGA